MARACHPNRWWCKKMCFPSAQVAFPHLGPHTWYAIVKWVAFPHLGPHTSGSTAIVRPIGCLVLAILLVTKSSSLLSSRAVPRGAWTRFVSATTRLALSPAAGDMALPTAVDERSKPCQRDR